MVIDLVKTKSYRASMKTANVHYAKTHLSRLLQDVQHGDVVVITNGKTPVGRLTAIKLASGRTRPRVGTVTSEAVECSDDAFLPLTDAELREWGL